MRAARIRSWLREQRGMGPAFAWHAVLPALLALDEMRRETIAACEEATE